jgi:predicted ATPase
MVYVITGGPGFGKTTVLNLLAGKGFPVGSETARELLNENFTKVPTTERRYFPSDFERNVANERINFLQSIAQNTIAFADRGLPDQIAYSWYKRKEPSAFIEQAASIHKYAPFVFVTPPWQEIFVRDEIRKETFVEATEIHGLILKSYLKFGYRIVDLPLFNPELRVKYIREFLGI